MREGRWSALGDVAGLCLLVAALAALVVAALVGAGALAAAGTVAGGTVAALVVVLAARHVRERRRAREREATEDALAALGSVTDPTISTLDVDGLVAEVLTRTRHALHADVACLLVPGDDPARLDVRAVAGSSAPAEPNGALDVAPEVLCELARREGPFVTDGPLRAALCPGEGAPGSLASLAACPTVVACPLVAGARLLGVLLAGSHAGAVAPGDLRLLGVAAGRLAGTLERSRLDEAERRSRLASEHAHLHLRVLARAGAVLGMALDSYVPALKGLGDAVVPDFADWFAVDLLEEGAVFRVTASWSARGTTVTRSPTAGRPLPSPHPSLEGLVRLAFAEMRPQVLAGTGRLATELPDAGVHRASDLVATPGAPDTGGGVDSIVVVPARLGDACAGAFTFVRRAGRRGYRPSDVEVARELVDRVVVAVERVLAWQESRRSAEVAQRHAERLGQLVEASLVVNAQLGESEVLHLLAERAQRVLDAAYVAVAALADGDLVIEAEWPPSPSQAPHGTGASRLAARRRAAAARAAEALERGAEPSRRAGAGAGAWTAVALPGPSDMRRRAVVALAREGDLPAEDAESVLTLLAQTASVALQNAQLYARVSSNERRLQAVVEASPLAIAELQPTGALRWANGAASRLFGPGGPLPPAPGAPPARPAHVSSHAHDDGSVADHPAHHPAAPGAVSLAGSGPRLTSLLEQARAGSSTVGAELSALGPDGERRELSVSASPLVDEGEVTGVLLIAQDVTEARRMLEQVHGSERLAATSRMAGALAHDFNNLLTVILGSSEVLAREVQGDAALHDVAAIRRAGARAAELTGQLLRIGQGRPAQPEVLDVGEVLESMRPVLTSVLGPAVELEISGRGRPALVVLDRADIERAVLNLAINARDAMPGGGRFSIDARARAVGRGEGTVMEMAFTDTGAGMDAETAAHCLEPFFTTKPRGRGTGLGLATVHATVTQAGGELRVASEPGRGTCITVSLPAHDPVRRSAPRAAHARRRVRSGGAATAGRTGSCPVVLFVDDEAELVRLGARALEDSGCSVVTAYGAIDALALLGARRGAVDLLVTDAVMPGMSGTELATAVARRFPEVPVLFTSGYMDADGAARLRLPVGARLLEKPYSPDELAASVRAMLDARRRARPRGGQRPAPTQGSNR